MTVRDQMKLTTIKSDALEVKINPKGAELCSVKDRSGFEYMWQADPQVWPRHAPVLFPVVGKLKNDRYRYNGTEYTLTQHGFARDRLFDLAEEKQGACSFLLKPDEETRRIYPFDFELTIGYLIEKNRLSITYDVRNTGVAGMLFSIGGHPGFNCPFSADESYDDCYIEFTGDSLMQRCLDNGLRGGEHRMTQLRGSRLYLSKDLFDNDALVFENHQVERARLAGSKSGRSVTLECPGWPYFGVWAKKGCTNFVCLEPWHGVADDVLSTGELALKDGITRLERGEKFSAGYTIVFD